MSYRSYKNDLVSDGVFNVSKEIERTGSNHVQEQAALRIFIRSFHLGKKRKGNNKRNNFAISHSRFLWTDRR